MLLEDSSNILPNLLPNWEWVQPSHVKCIPLECESPVTSLQMFNDSPSHILKVSQYMVSPSSTEQISIAVFAHLDQAVSKHRLVTTCGCWLLSIIPNYAGYSQSHCSVVDRMSDPHMEGGISYSMYLGPLGHPCTICPHTSGIVPWCSQHRFLPHALFTLSYLLFVFYSYMRCGSMEIECTPIHISIEKCATKADPALQEMGVKQV